MISAATAREKSLLNAQASKYFKLIENGIDRAISKGETNCIVEMDLLESVKGKAITMAIKNEMDRLGYNIETQYAKDLPFGCPLDQFSFNNGSFIIDWSE